MDLFGGLEALRVAAAGPRRTITTLRPGRGYVARAGTPSTLLTGLYAPEPCRPGEQAWFRNRGFGAFSSPPEKE